MLDLKQIVVVSLGGALGSVARYKLGGLILHRATAWNFPLSTFSINVLGCLVIGILAALVEHHDLFSASTRLFLFTGLLGGFTTFSAFGYEALFLLRRNMPGLSILYVVLSVLCGFVALWIGTKIVDLVWPPHH